jgi:leader peptidase (prepilin peptidase) / N-methyltransferase
VLGLLVGSFLNVVIHRLPKMMERQWAAECAELQARPTPGPPAPAPLNLMVPRSRCPHCGHRIRWHENMPVVSYLLLRGRCRLPGPIGRRYPLVEILTGALFGWVAGTWGQPRNAGVVRFSWPPSWRWPSSTGTPPCCPTTSPCRCSGPGWWPPPWA